MKTSPTMHHESQFRTATLLLACLFLMGAHPALAASDPDALKIAALMTKAHGGMEAWARTPAITFTDEWVSMGPPSRTVVEQGRRRVTMDVIGTDQSLAWDGEKAWSLNWKSPMPPRFVALLNYYFLNLPWLVHDPGVALGKPEKARLWEDPVDYTTIMMTFEKGVGDTPEDYYRLYVHPETHELKACAYIVTYKALLPEGATATPEHILVYDAWTTVSGLKVPAAFTIYEQDHTRYAACAVRDWSFSQPIDASRMTMPAGAVVDESRP